MEDWTVDGSTDRRIRPVQRGPDQEPRRQGVCGQDKRGEQQERRRKDHRMQAPVARAGQSGFRGEAGAVQEEQQRDGDRREVAGDDRAKVMHRQQRGQAHHADDRRDIGVDR